MVLGQASPEGLGFPGPDDGRAVLDRPGRRRLLLAPLRLLVAVPPGAAVHHAGLLDRHAGRVAGADSGAFHVPLRRAGHRDVAVAGARRPLAARGGGGRRGGGAGGGGLIGAPFMFLFVGLGIETLLSLARGVRWRRAAAAGAVALALAIGVFNGDRSFFW